MPYRDRVEKSLKELLKKGLWQGRFVKKNETGFNKYDDQKGRQIKGKDSDGAYTVVKSTAGYYSFGKDGSWDRLWAVMRVKEYGSDGHSTISYIPHLAAEALMKKAHDEFAPWVGVKIGLTELGYVPKEVYLDGRSVNIEHLLMKDGGMADDVESVDDIYSRIAAGLSKVCEERDMRVSEEFMTYFFLHLKKYLQEYIISRIDADATLTPAEREKLKKEAEEIIWFVEKRVDKVS